MTTDERIAALEARIDELQTRIAVLGRRDSMHTTFTCPGCGNGRVLAVKQVNENNGVGGVPIALGNYKRWFDGPEGDPVYVYVCTACRLIEWHAYSLTHLRPDGETVTEYVQPAESVPPGPGPYR